MDIRAWIFLIVIEIDKNKKIRIREMLEKKNKKQIEMWEKIDSYKDKGNCERK